MVLRIAMLKVRLLFIQKKLSYTHFWSFSYNLLYNVGVFVHFSPKTPVIISIFVVFLGINTINFAINFRCQVWYDALVSVV